MYSSIWLRSVCSWLVRLLSFADSLALVQSLSAVASPYELHVMEGMPHGFMQMEFFGDARRCIERTQRFLATELARSRRSDLRGFGLRIARAVGRVFG